MADNTGMLALLRRRTEDQRIWRRAEVGRTLGGENGEKAVLGIRYEKKITKGKLNKIIMAYYS